MINHETNTVKTFDLNNAWREVLELTASNGYDYLIQEGSYQGQFRRQLPNLQVIVAEPSSFSLAPIMPLGFPVIANESAIIDYFMKYILSPIRQDGNEEYSYGESIMLALPRVIEMLKNSSGGTNQAAINILGAESVKLANPPCLRTITFSVVNGFFSLSAFFRSWDVFAALPLNLGALTLLNEYVANETGFTPGMLVVYSSGAHIYEQYFEQVNKLNVFKIVLAEDC